jgi:nucleotide-binding universal stress UspA family protein
MFREDSYKSILIPVDFSINTEVAVKKTLEMVSEKDAIIHLLHVYSYRSAKQLPQGNLSVEDMLEEWKISIQESEPSFLVYSEVIRNNSVQQSIAKKAKEYKADLIVIGQRSNHSWLPFLNTVMPVQLAEASGCAVLTVKPGALYSKIRTVVVPVTTNVTVHKIQAITALCKKFKLKIHLVTFMADEDLPDEGLASSFLKIYQWLKDSRRCPVEYAVLHGRNKAKAILNYSKKIDADMLLVNAATETKVGRLNTHISDLLPAASRMQVLTLQTEN